MKIKAIYCADCGENLGDENDYFDCECGSHRYTYKGPKYNGVVRKRSMDEYLTERMEENKKNFRRVR